MLYDQAQVHSQFAGDYQGMINGDIVKLHITQSGTTIEGSMVDSKQQYKLTGQANGEYLNANAVERALGITFVLTGRLIDNNIQMHGDLVYYGNKTPAFDVVFYSTSNSNENQNIESTIAPSQISQLQGKSIDPTLIGNWREEQHYNSGYGSDFSGATYTYMGFNPDHTISDNGSSASISGSNYSGRSQSNNAKVIPNLWYYTQGNKIIAVILNNGQYIETPLGTYYIENGKMLFTQANTNKKILYYKQ